MAKEPSLLAAVAGMKCPNCRKGKMFSNKSVFPFKKMLDMPERCAECGQKMEIEPGFYYGTGYVSYGLSIALTVFNLVWFLIFIGIDFRDNSLFWFIGVDVVIVLLLQPWIMRYSRVVYLSMFVKYGSYDKNDDQHIPPADAPQQEIQTS
ncbi:DUF983 domain-containing protein [Edaphocola flava]|jgi:uncharacterized protein (DUF983 family)|uniref:DUF983 domain-containing protein n=1 Tax=Edaphocola flava TaxID=2499629 RepID=UPI00100C1385|nr:DUF983 domain-containing protein [Edaphocola flava]